MADLDALKREPAAPNLRIHTAVDKLLAQDLDVPEPRLLTALEPEQSAQGALIQKHPSRLQQDKFAETRVRVLACLHMVDKMNEAQSWGRTVDFYTRNPFTIDPEEQAEFIDSIGSESAPESYRDHPGEKFFEQSIWPAARRLGSTPEEVNHYAELGMRCYEILYKNALETRMTERVMPSGELFESFFEEGGLFELYAGKYGATAAKAITAHYMKALERGERSMYAEKKSEKESGLSLEQKMIARIALALNGLNEKYHEAFFQCVWAYAQTRMSDQEHIGIFLDNATPTINDFIALGRADLLPMWFYFMTLGPGVSAEIGKVKAQGPQRVYGFPYFNAKACIKEFDAMNELGELRNPVLRFVRGKLLYKDGQWPREAGASMTKHRPKCIYIPGLLEKMREKGHTDEQIAEILSIPDENPWLSKHAAYDVVRHYSIFNESFPGGVPAMLEFLENLNATPAFQRAMLTAFLRDDDLRTPKEGEEQTPWFSEKGMQTYLRIAKKVSDELGDFGVSYGMLHNRLQKKVVAACEDPETFERRIDLIIKFSKSLEGQHTLLSDSIRGYIFSGIFRWINMEEDKFTEFIAGLERVIAASLPEDKLDVRAGDACSRMIGEYVYLSEEPWVPTIASNEYMPLLLEKLGWSGYADLIIELYEKGGVQNVRKTLEARIDGYTKQGCSTLAAMTMVSSKKMVKRLIGKTLSVPHVELVAYKKRLERYKQLLIEANQTADNGDPNFRYFHGTLAIREILDEIEADEAALEEQGHLGFKEIKERAQKIVALALRRDLLGIAVRTQTLALDTGDMENATPGTKAAFMGGSLVHAFGMLHTPGINSDIEPVYVKGEHAGRLIANIGTTRPEWAAEILQEIGDTVRRNLQRVMPRVHQQIINERRAWAGVPAAGGKLHSPEEEGLPRDVLQSVAGLFGFDQTLFSLMHHNSALLAPAPTGLELTYQSRLLQFAGMNVTSIQMCGAGRWHLDQCADVAATMIVASPSRVVYQPDSFVTTHEQLTGRRMVIYGDGVLNRSVPFFVDGIPQDEDRTDFLGHTDVETFTLFVLMNALSQHLIYGGRYQKLADRTFRRIKRVMGQMGVNSLIPRTSWVWHQANKLGQEADSPENHAHVINQIGALRDREILLKGNMGLVGEIDKILRDAAGEIIKMSQTVMAQEPKEFERMMRF